MKTLTIDEAATELKVSTRTIFRYISRGKLKTVYIAPFTRVHITEESVLKIKGA